ncbi:MAG: hypothetical protein V2J51_13350 [Erythrobacter sp.]|nr:hypothetical protein [Erythrobacter sp.]
MEDTHFVEKVRMALQLAREETWDHPIPKTPMRLNVLLTMLNNRFPAYWNEEADRLADELLRSSHALALKLDEFDTLTMGFAMRTQRFVKRSLDNNPSPAPGRRARTRQ